jgi:diguanylate cyclase
VLSHLALSDPLTGLPNRRAWNEELERRIARLPEGGDLLLAVMDLDQFKKINDEQGHLVGDEVLKNAARALVAGVRDADFVARIGGDEFGLLMEDFEPGQARAIVDRVRGAITEATQSEGTVTSSAGVAIASDSNQAERLFSAADESLRDAKQAGRNCTMQSAPRHSSGG